MTGYDRQHGDAPFSIRQAQETPVSLQVESLWRKALETLVATHPTCGCGKADATHDVTVLKWHRHTMLLSLSTYFRCLMPPSASNASSWATKNIVSRHEVKTYLGKSLKTTAFPVHCTLSLPKVTSDDSAECHLMKACFFKNKHVYKVYIFSSWARWPYQHHSLANWCPRLESLVVLSDRPNVLPQCTVFGSILTCSSGSNHGFGGWKLEQKSCH